MQAVILPFCLTACYLRKTKQNGNKVNLLSASLIIHLPLQDHLITILPIIPRLRLITMTLKSD